MEGVRNILNPARMFLICRKYHCENGKESPIVEDLVTRHRRALVGFSTALEMTLKCSSLIS